MLSPCFVRVLALFKDEVPLAESALLQELTHTLTHTYPVPPKYVHRHLPTHIHTTHMCGNRVCRFFDNPTSEPRKIYR